jgi:hypothetical protein
MDREPSASLPRIHAVVTIHGMGDPRPNSTLAPVAERFAWSCGMEPSRSRGETLSLGMLTGRTGIQEPLDSGFAPALQLKGVRLKPFGPDENCPIFPIPGLWEDHDLYFADLFWSPVTDKAFDQTGDALEPWTKGLINRLYRKQLHVQEKPKEEKENYWWVVDSLTLLQKTLVVAEKMASLRFKKITDLVFGKYLGDVQLYGESPNIRGKAVKVFHETMAGLHAQLRARHPNAQIEYTLLAHSLGTVLTFDALLSAMARPELLAQPASGDPGQLPFPGYHAKGKNLPDLGWSQHVRALVTLGSPIDKFLTLWWHNYDYLTCPEKWMRNDLPRVKHYNFCDEQDPVGHNLDLARTAPAYKALFVPDPEGKNDLLYNHTPYAGYAHIDYWKDQSLFDLIHRRVVAPDAKTGPEDISDEDKAQFPMTSPQVTKWIKRLHFLVLPALLALVTHFVLLGTLLAKSWHSAALWTVALVLAFWFSRQILGLNLAWRQVLKQKRKLSPLSQRKAESYPESSQWSWRTTTVILGLLSLVAMPVLVHQKEEWKDLQAGIIGFTAVMLVMSLIAFWKFFPRRQKQFSSRPPDLLVADWPEKFWIFVSFLPTLIALSMPGFIYLFSLFGKDISIIPKIEGRGFGLLLFVAPLLQVATWVWVEMWVLHAQVKRRFSQGQLLKDPKFTDLEIKSVKPGIGFSAYAKDA